MNSTHAIARRSPDCRVRSGKLLATALLAFTSMFAAQGRAQNASASGSEHSTAQETPGKETTEQEVQRLSAAMAQAAAQVEASQRLLLELQQQIAVLKLRMAAESAASPGKEPEPAPAAQAASAVTATPAALEDLQEQLAVATSQIATHDQTKVETQSKFPLTLSGLLLFNTFVNTHQVDIASAPSYVLSGSGNTGFSIRQTILGLDARGPHLFGATSHADLRTDFFSGGSGSGYSEGGNLRLRTAHAELKWPSTEAFFALDRALIEPNAPTSLLSLGQPELAWAGNLWTWNPQVGVSQLIGVGKSAHLQAQAALIDASDPLTPGESTTVPAINASERSRWPGSEGRIAWTSNAAGPGAVFGAGGYFSPHRSANGDRYDAWAATIDAKLPIGRHFEVTANAYRGQALGGLGAGGYVDFVYRYSTSYKEVAVALDDVGGWAQMKARAGERFEWNAGFGIDNPFAGEIESAASSYNYLGLARNRSLYSNVIFSPKASLLFSLEYRRLWSNYLGLPTDRGDAIGLGAGYKF